MSGPRRPRTRRELPDSVGVLISHSSNFTVGGRKPPGVDDDQEAPPDPPKKQPRRYRLRTFTGRVLEGQLMLPGEIAGDLLFGIAFVVRDDETSILTAALEGNAVLFDEADFETVAGAHATVSYLTAI